MEESVKEGVKEGVREGVKPDLELAKRVLQTEAEGILALVPRLGDAFLQAVEILYACKGRVVVTGMGKSGIIGKKIAATLASTGTPALFLHPAEGIHGDLGMITKGDVVLAISNSGETAELVALLPPIKRLNLRLISMTGRPDSTLARRSDVVLDISVRAEACPMNLVPTTSTTAALAMGDALAVTLLEMRGFRPEDFAAIHPGGTLGKRLLLTVADVMHTGSEIPIVQEQTLMREAVFEITSKKLGITAVVNGDGRLTGVITDGDLRRWLERGVDLFRLTAGEVMTRNPKTIRSDELAAKAVSRMEEHAITALPIVDEEGRPSGIVHLHDLLKAGVV